jgi:hypothetical protein
MKFWGERPAHEEIQRYEAIIQGMGPGNYMSGMDTRTMEPSECWLEVLAEEKDDKEKEEMQLDMTRN